MKVSDVKSRKDATVTDCKTNRTIINTFTHTRATWPYISGDGILLRQAGLYVDKNKNQIKIMSAQ
jgi:hypothetical protein